MRRIALVVLCVVAACGRSPSGPTSAPPAPAPQTPSAQFGGLWNASFRVTNCAGDRHCFFHIGTSRPFSLRLQQSGSQVRGLFTTIGYWATDVAGTVRDDGLLVLSGTEPPASDRDGSFSARLELRTSGPGTLSGTVAYDTTPAPQNTDFLSPATYGGPVEQATHDELSAFASSIDGTWSGDSVVRSCTPAPGSGYCYPLTDRETSTLQLTLTAAGAGITGTLRLLSSTVPVSGTLSGSAITLSGEARTAVSGGVSLSRVSEWTARIDEFGRMKGTFRFEQWWPADAPRLGESATIEFAQVFKQ